MPQIDYRVLGQASVTTTGNNPVSAVLYTVPTGKQAVVSSVCIRNGSGHTSFGPVSAIYGLAVGDSTMATGSRTSIFKNFIAAGLQIDPEQTVVYTCGFTLSAGDQIAILGSCGGETNVTCNIYGTAFGAQYIP